MKQKVTYILTAVSSLLVGAALMYLLIVFVPLKTINNDTVTTLVKVEEQATLDALEKVSDAVVVVESYAKNKESGTGTGFVYKKENGKGYIITNAHVIDGADTIEVIFTDNDRATATLLGSDEYADIAVLSVDEKYIITSTTFGNSEKTKVGSTVFTVGSPLGSDYSGSVTKGIVSGKDRLVSVSISGKTNDWMVRALQTDAAINPGNSGSPLINLAGDVIGVTSLKLVDSDVEGMGFAIPIEDVQKYLDDLEAGKKISRPYVGVTLINASDYYSLFIAGLSVNRDIAKGAIIASVAEESQAKEAGIKKGDVITKINDDEVTDVASFRYYLYSHEIGDTITVTYIRDSKESTVKIKLEEASE